MRKNLRSKILLCILAGGVLAANTAFAAEYTETISGDKDTSYNAIKDVNGNDYTYNFTDGDSLKLTDSTNGIIIDNNNVDSITVNNSLDLYMDNTNYDVWKSSGMAGIVINNTSDSTIKKTNGGNITINVNNCDGKTFSEVSGVKIAIGTSNNTIEIGNSQINVNVLKAQYGVMAKGLSTEGTNNKIVMGDGIINVTAESALNEKGEYYVDACAVAAYDKTEIKTGDVDITATAIGNEFVKETLANGIDAEFGESTVITGNGDVIATAVNTGVSYANAIYAADGATITKGDGNIIAKSEGTDTIEARGIFANNGTVNVGVADIKAETIGGNDDSKSIGLYVWYNGEINLAGGSITAVADNEDVYTAAICAYDDSLINVNQGTANRVVINGNVENYGDGAINLNLNTADSVLTGSIEDENGTLNLANGARWNATGISEVNELTMNHGNIYVDTPFWADIKILKYSGTGNILFKADDTDNEGVVNIDTSSVVFDDAEEGSFINVGVANTTINTLDVDKTEENLNVLAGKVFYDGDNDNLNGKVVIKEGLITPEASGDLLFDQNDNRGYVTNITGGDRVTQTMDAMQHLAETAIVAWRQEDSTLSQRLGELRNSDGGQGIWVRMSRGEFEYDGAYKNQYNFFQMGYDWASGNWHYGAAVSHNDGQTTYAQGDGENRSTSLSLYGTWLGDKGHYADIVLKQGRLSNDFDIYTEAGHTSGDYDAWGTSLSGEYGMKVALNDGWYVTPQAQLTLMRIGSEDYTTNNGIKVHQDSLESAVGRVGFELGKDISESGSIYAKASLLHDFAGSADTYLSMNGLTNSYRQDIGDTWCEAGIGFNYKTSANSYVYADVVKTFGGDVDTPWQWNAGMRWTF